MNEALTKPSMYEELFFKDESFNFETIRTIGLAAIERGYHLLLLDGPGQGESLLNNLYYRFDWEKVITPVVDFALTLACVDKDKIALYGASMGGYLAPRAVAFEPRINACIANGGVSNFFAAMIKVLPPELILLAEQHLKLCSVSN